MSSVDEQYAKARERMRQEMPAEEAGAVIQPMGLFGRGVFGLKKLLAPGSSTLAVTNPLTGNISYNRAESEGQSDANIADTLAHELRHRRQVLQTPVRERLLHLLGDLLPGGEPYHRRPDEMEAFNTEVERAVKEGRTAYTPDFWTGEFVPRADIPLRRAAVLKGLKK